MKNIEKIMEVSCSRIPETLAVALIPYSTLLFSSLMSIRRTTEILMIMKRMKRRTTEGKARG
jgi:hypothetical protein